MSEFTEVPKSDKQKKSVLRTLNKAMKSAVEGVNFNIGNVVRQMPFIFFIGLITILYIANTYYAEKTIREINQTKKELKDLRAEYIYTKSELMFSSRQSEISKMVADMEIKQSVVPPRKITETKKKN
ncbi:MAG TPA: FtsL-like putative cell division protein [Bacteroidia bacterium]|nr:FtsL-like putative cell division protein [Bacteroidia bacterium]